MKKSLILAVGILAGLLTPGITKAETFDLNYYRKGDAISTSSQLTTGKYFLYAYSKGVGAFVAPSGDSLAAKSIYTTPGNGVYDINVSNDGTFTITTPTGITIKTYGTSGIGQGNLSAANSGTDKTDATFKLSDQEVTGQDADSPSLFFVELANAKHKENEGGTTTAYICTNGDGADGHLAYWENIGSPGDTGQHYTALAFYPAIEDKITIDSEKIYNLKLDNGSYLDLTSASDTKARISTSVKTKLRLIQGTGNNAGKFAIQNAENNKYFSTSSTSTDFWTSKKAENTAYYWNIIPYSDGSIVITHNDNTGRLAGTQSNNAEDNVWTDNHVGRKFNNNTITAHVFWTPEEVEGAENCQVTFNCTLVNNVTISMQATGLIGHDASTIIPPLNSFYTISGLTESNTIISNDNKTFTVNCTWNNPILYNTVYRLQVKPFGSDNHSNNVVVTNTEGTDITTNTSNKTDININNFWFFKLQGYDQDNNPQVTLHPLANPEQGISFNNNNSGTSGFFTSEPVTMTLVPSTNSSALPTDFCLIFKMDNTTHHINDRTDKLSTWTSGNTENNGCAIRALALTENDFEELGYVATTQEVDAAKANPTPDVVKPLIEKYASAISVTVTFPDFNLDTMVLTSKIAENNSVEGIIQKYISDNGGMKNLQLPADMTVTSSNSTFTVQGQWKNSLRIGEVYRMKLRSLATSTHNLYWPATNSLSDAPKTRTSTNENVFEPEHLWYFKDAGTTDDGEQKVTLHTIALSDEYGYTGENVSADSKAGTMSTNPTVFVIKKCGNGAPYHGFSLAHVDSNDATHVNDCAGNLGTWHNNSVSRDDDGSGFRLYALTEEDFNSIHITQSNESITTTAAAAKSNPSAENVRAFFNSVWPYQEELLSGYYRIIAINGNHGAITVTGYGNHEGQMDNTNETRMTEQIAKDEFDLSQIWQFRSYGNSPLAYPYFVLSNPNANGYHLGTPAGSSTASHQTFITQTDTYGVKLNMHKNEGNQWVAQIDRNNSYINPSNQNSDIFKYSGGFNDTGNLLTIEKVTSIPVTIPENQKYVTACFPMDVKIPDNVNAYTIESQIESEGKSYFKISAKSEVIEAGTGVILEAGAGTYNFTILDSSVEAFVDKPNLLTGVTLKRNNVAAGNHYALAGEEFVLTTEDTNVPANTAYVAANSLESVPANTTLQLTRFDDPATSINEVGITVPAKEGVYDLQGRRVAKAAKGIYIINGKKTLVK